jgi:hypothetical protein
MKNFRHMLVVPVFVAGAFLSPLQTVASADEPAALPSMTGLDLSMRSHDDWPLAAVSIASGQDMSLRTHDDWPLAVPSEASSLDLSLRAHDDWALRTR